MRERSPNKLSLSQTVSGFRSEAKSLFHKILALNPYGSRFCPDPSMPNRAKSIKTNILAERYQKKSGYRFPRPAVKTKAARVRGLFLRFPESVDPVNPHADQLIDAEVVNSSRAHVADVFRRHVVDAHRDQFVGIGMRVSQPLQLLNKLRRNAVDAKRNQLLQANVVVTALLKFGHPFRSRAMNSHGDQRIFIRRITSLMKTAHHLRTHTMNAESDKFVGVGNLQSLRAQCLNERCVHTENAERDQLVRVNIAEMLALHLPRKFQADVH